MGFGFRFLRIASFIVAVAVIGIGGCFYEGPSPAVSAWSRPINQGEHWVLEGLISGQIIPMTTLHTKLLLSSVRYGGGELWALLGIESADGEFYSLVDGAETAVEIRQALSQVRRVTLLFSDRPESLLWQTPTRPAWAAIAVAQLDLPSGAVKEGAVGSMSKLFIQTGAFPDLPEFGILAWKLVPGALVETGLEGN